MGGGPLAEAVRRLCQLLGPRGAGELPDGQLLRRFVLQRDEGAFEALVRRHGPMVLGVCRRLLGDGPDAEDAFQATFLVLVRKARSLRQGALVGNWLYGVAYRIGVRARAYAARRRAGQRPIPDVPAPEVPSAVGEREVQGLLDEELSRLPEKYRAPVVLCYLQGKTNEEAARELGWPKGTVATRLSRARERLRARLARRGLAPSAGLFAAEVTVAPALVGSTVRAALAGHPAASASVAALTKGALREMFFVKVRLLTAVVLTMGVVGAGVLAYQARTAPRPEAPDPPDAESAEAPDVKPAPRPRADAPKADARVQPGDVLKVQATDTLPGQPISGAYTVEPSGKLPLGFTYGRVDVGGRTIEEAEVAIRKHLAPMLKDSCEVSATWVERAREGGRAGRSPWRIRPGMALDIRAAEAFPGQPLSGVYTVEPSGKVPLGFSYGRVSLAGRTLEEAEEVLRKHLTRILPLPVSVSVTLPGAIRLSGFEDEGGVEQRLRRLEEEVRELRAAIDTLRGAKRK